MRRVSAPNGFFATGLRLEFKAEKNGKEKGIIFNWALSGNKQLLKQYVKDHVPEYKLSSDVQALLSEWGVIC